MRILYVAKHRQPRSNDDEGAISDALQRLGHEVVELDESVNPRQFRGYPADFVLFHHLQNPNFLKRHPAPKVFWYFDRVECHDLILRGRMQARLRWMHTAVPICSLGFCTDGDWVAKDATRKLRCLSQGADDRAVGFGEPKSPVVDLMFAGARNHSDARTEQIRQMERRYGSSFRTLEGGQRVYRRDFADAVASSRIVVAPRSPISDRYWSNRVYVVLGFGGFLLHPFSRGLTRHYEDKKEIVFYRNLPEMYRLVDYYLEHPEERRAIQEAGLERTRREHTYFHRCQELTRVVQERLRV